ncbi:MAG TPA: hypothetical protein VN445_14700 [Rectinemataceae bacterium]|nr:hypothetical protein [Rectinemataceae bacterium]
MAKEENRKVYDYDRELVRGKLLGGFRATGREATVADLAGLTGLPLQQIEAELPAVADEFGARLRVTEKGDILYSFPDGMKSRYKGFGPTLKRILRTVKKGAIEVSKAVFKVWIMVMLVGYFVLFIALALFAMVASVAVQQGGGGRDSRSDNRRGGGGLGGLWLTTRLFDSFVRIWFYSELFKSPETRSRQFMDRRERRPLPKAVFSHVFGDGDPNVKWPEVEKKAVVAFLQTHKGIITMAEFMAISGLDPVDAELAINKYLLEFEGSPEVSESGALYFSFPKLLSRVGTTPELMGSTVALKRLNKFSSNTPKADRVFRFINVFNLAFGGYFLYNALTIGSAIYVRTADGYALRGGLSIIYSAAGYLFQMLGAANPIPGLFWGLGVVPLVFSGLFFAIPLIRSIKQKAEDEKIKFENLRRVVYRNILSARDVFRPESVTAPLDEARPADAHAAEKIAKRLAAWSNAEPASGGYEYREILRTQEEAEKQRLKIDISAFAPGKAIFDTES